MMESEETLMGLDRKTVTLPFKSVVENEDAPVLDGDDEEDGV